MRSPWNGGSISLRWRRCSGPSRMRIELGPTNGSRKLELAPARTTSAGAVNTARTSAGSETTTIGASVHAVRSVNGTPWRAALRRSSVVGRASHSQVWRAGGADGPGGSTARDVTTCAGAARGGRRLRRGASAAELPGAQREQLRVQRAGPERVGDGVAAVERERGLDRAVDLGDEDGVVERRVGQRLACAAVAVERAEAHERRARRPRPRGGSRPRTRAATGVRRPEVAASALRRIEAGRWRGTVGEQGVGDAWQQGADASSCLLRHNLRLRYAGYYITSYTLLMVMTQACPHELALIEDFVNTVDKETGEEALGSPEALAAWLAEHGLAEPGAPLDHDDLAGAVAIREDLRALLLANNGGELDPERPRRALRRRRPRAADRRARRRRHAPASPRARAGSTASPAACSASSPTPRPRARWDRLKACPWHTCQVAFYDHSRNRSRTWCSMAVCGNRAKAAAPTGRSAAPRASPPGTRTSRRRSAPPPARPAARRA